MRHGPQGALLGALLLAGPAPLAWAQTDKPAAIQVTPAAMAEYKKKLAAYEQARAAFEADAVPYWASITEKRKSRIAKRRNREEIVLEDYVLTQPPAYSGPPRPVDPSAPDKPPPERKYIPVVKDFLGAANEHFQFVPTPPSNEMEYKRAYATAASAAGLTREQCVRIYGFEAGGNGRYDVQAGLEQPRPNARPISTALGYNQLLTTNSVELAAEIGDTIIAELQRRAWALKGDAKRAMEAKLATVHRMIAFTRTVPDTWSEHDRLANTQKGWALHALVLDIDIGPILQVHKLLTSVKYAKAKGYLAPLSAAELEMMNLTGDGSGFDMVTMPAAMREKVPTSNFFQRGGYERNTVAIRNNTVAKLIAGTDAVMDREIKQQGAKDLAAAF